MLKSEGKRPKKATGNYNAVERRWKALADKMVIENRWRDLIIKF
jgi:hypothetical protein